MPDVVIATSEPAISVLLSMGCKPPNAEHTGDESKALSMSLATALPLARIKALTFDVFGTTVDWRTSVVDELTLRAHRKQLGTLPSPLKSRLQNLGRDDWCLFAQAWRNSYTRFVRAFNPESDAWKPIDEHHHDSLIQLLEEWGLEGLYTEDEVESLSLVWHRLYPWPDTVDGLARLNSSGKLVLATLSNGNEGLVRDLVDFAGLQVDELFCAETFLSYKPHPETYLGAARRLNLEPGQVAMVACHLDDLQGARKCGLRTIYVERPGEEAWGKESADFDEAKQWVDLWVGETGGGFVTMASRLLDALQ
ncbi:uncharacterized protein UV8b_07518 [Ustilaginoidea virens]|uniref:Uncharacterized protein n=1 Tax=Ustilaginoidea virens TaxID=1159556 RepID=A0A063BL10_USTVR|nr:uncharacterized protein UV8b_07518 [Ustilaginoidea virens]QUC23277.1 hypothetical protein UV8b_07518 [Ustilaginoidea virens]GAO14349.1 hypothetical protein UVI_02034240 [Ustilaginoidea virens]